MNIRGRTAVQGMRAATKHDKVKKIGKEKKTGMQGSKAVDSSKVPSRLISRRERKLALQHDVDKLKKKLRHEENVHRALERAFTRPLGALPRLPPYLPSYTLELLAEVAVLEEEVVRLEEQVVNFRQGLYQEAIYVSSSKRSMENSPDSNCAVYQSQNSKPSSQLPNSQASIFGSSAALTWWSSNADQNGLSSNRFAGAKRQLKKPNPCPATMEDCLGKENQASTNAARNTRQPLKRAPRIRNVQKTPNAQSESPATNKGRAEESLNAVVDVVSEEASGPNKLSEAILKCLMNIFLRISLPKNTATDSESSPSVSGSSENSDDTDFGDPYRICKEFGRKDIGPYKCLCSVEASSIDLNLIAGCFLTRRLKFLLRKLSAVELGGLNHQQKLAFWINIYNSCMMNAFLEQGIPENPQMVVALMPKAMINVGGHSLSAMTIEHFILRLPYQSKYTYPKGIKNEEMRTRGMFGLDWPEPLVTFALSCGSWSSPAVRIYTASGVDEELDAAKSDYLQAALGISRSNKLAIPKLIDWYLLDFAKDVESLMDWICLQLPSELRNDAVKCLEMGRNNPVPQLVQVLPYDFSFRYLLAP